MRRFHLLIFVLALGAAARAQTHSSAHSSAQGTAHGAITTWLTTPDRSSLLAEQTGALHFAPAGGAQTPALAIDVDEGQSFQTIDGFGLALTGGSAQLMMRMGARERSALIKELFRDDGRNIGVSYLRVSVGSSDMNERVYSYDDMPAGETDPTLSHFSLEGDRATVIPVLKEILAVNPHIAILASPWSAPAWMKTNGDVKAGSLKPEDYQVYAAYLVRYLQAMQAEGITVHALTMQNEPLNPKNTPSMVVQAPEEGTFLKEALGPQLRKAGLGTEVILYDHNCDRPDYPMSILADGQAAQYTVGSGFHLYAGQTSAMTEVHDAYPAKNLYFTEQMVVDRPGVTELAIAAPESRVVVGAIRNWSRNVLLWNLAADPEDGPHTNNGGCTMCEGAITLDGDTVTRNLAYYTIAHASKFVPPGSVRIASATVPGADGGASVGASQNASGGTSGGTSEATVGADTLAHVAFRTPSGGYAMIVVNGSATPQSFAIGFHNRIANAGLPAGAVATYVW